MITKINEWKQVYENNNKQKWLNTLLNTLQNYYSLFTGNFSIKNNDIYFNNDKIYTIEYPTTIKKILNDIQYNKIPEIEKQKKEFNKQKNIEKKDLLKIGTNIKIEDGIKKLQKLYNSFNEFTINTKALYNAIDYLKSGHKMKAKTYLDDFNKYCKEKLKKLI